MEIAKVAPENNFNKVSLKQFKAARYQSKNPESSLSCAQ
jgi:hypothetical protein